MVIEFTSYGYKENGIYHNYPEDYNQKNHVVGIYGDHRGYAISVIQLINEPNQLIRIVVDEIDSSIMSFDKTLRDLKKLATKYQIRTVQVNEEYELEKIISSRIDYYPFDINTKELKINTGLI
ncbi:MAG: hypothetical protein SAK29_25835, partial [Scytonema sp. PMC 1069.18]|nr:hypothetical protein [Scytonema sp. PMC 1069.18]